MTDKRQKATKKCTVIAMNIIITKQSIFVENNSSSLEEGFEFSWRSIADEQNNFNVIDQEKNTIEQIILYLEPHDY